MSVKTDLFANDQCVEGCRSNDECPANEFCSDNKCHAVPGFVLLTEVMFSTKVGEVDCQEDDDDLCSGMIAATLFGQSSRDNPSGIQCEFSGNMADHLQDGKIVFNDQDSLQQCWEAPLNAEVQNNGQVEVLNSPTPDSWKLGKMCVAWDNADKLIQVCDLIRQRLKRKWKCRKVGQNQEHETRMSVHHRIGNIKIYLL